MTLAANRITIHRDRGLARAQPHLVASIHSPASAVRAASGRISAADHPPALCQYHNSLTLTAGCKSAKGKWDGHRRKLSHRLTRPSAGRIKILNFEPVAAFFFFCWEPMVPVENNEGRTEPFFEPSRFCKPLGFSTCTAPDVTSVPPRRPHSRPPSRRPGDRARVPANLFGAQVTHPRTA